MHGHIQSLARFASLIWLTVVVISPWTDAYLSTVPSEAMFSEFFDSPPTAAEERFGAAVRSTLNGYLWFIGTDGGDSSTNCVRQYTSWRRLRNSDPFLIPKPPLDCDQKTQVGLNSMKVRSRWSSGSGVSGDGVIILRNTWWFGVAPAPAHSTLLLVQWSHMFWNFGQSSVSTVGRAQIASAIDTAQNRVAVASTIVYRESCKNPSGILEDICKQNQRNYFHPAVVILEYDANHDFTRSPMPDEVATHQASCPDSDSLVQPRDLYSDKNGRLFEENCVIHGWRVAAHLWIPCDMSASGPQDGADCLRKEADDRDIEPAVSIAGNIAAVGITFKYAYAYPDIRERASSGAVFIFQRSCPLSYRPPLLGQHPALACPWLLIKTMLPPPTNAEYPDRYRLFGRAVHLTAPLYESTWCSPHFFAFPGVPSPLRPGVPRAEDATGTTPQWSSETPIDAPVYDAYWKELRRFIVTAATSSTGRAVLGDILRVHPYCMLHADYTDKQRTVWNRIFELIQSVLPQDVGGMAGAEAEAETGAGLSPAILHNLNKTRLQVSSVGYQADNTFVRLESGYVMSFTLPFAPNEVAHVPIPTPTPLTAWPFSHNDTHEAARAAFHEYLAAELTIPVEEVGLTGSVGGEGVESLDGFLAAGAPEVTRDRPLEGRVVTWQMNWETGEWGQAVVYALQHPDGPQVVGRYGWFLSLHRHPVSLQLAMVASSPQSAARGTQALNLALESEISGRNASSGKAAVVFDSSQTTPGVLRLDVGVGEATLTARRPVQRLPILADSVQAAAGVFVSSPPSPAVAGRQTASPGLGRQALPVPDVIFQLEQAVDGQLRITPQWVASPPHPVSANTSVSGVDGADTVNQRELFPQWTDAASMEADLSGPQWWNTSVALRQAGSIRGVEFGALLPGQIRLPGPGAFPPATPAISPLSSPAVPWSECSRQQLVRARLSIVTTHSYSYSPHPTAVSTTAQSSTTGQNGRDGANLGIRDDAILHPGAGLVVAGFWEHDVLTTSTDSAIIRVVVGCDAHTRPPPTTSTPDAPPEFIQREAADVLTSPGLRALVWGGGVGNGVEQPEGWFSGAFPTVFIPPHHTITLPPPAGTTVTPPDASMDTYPHRIPVWMVVPVRYVRAQNRGGAVVRSNQTELVLCFFTATVTSFSLYQTAGPGIVVSDWSCTQSLLPDGQTYASDEAGSGGDSSADASTAIPEVAGRWVDVGTSGMASTAVAPGHASRPTLLAAFWQEAVTTGQSGGTPVYIFGLHVYSITGPQWGWLPPLQRLQQSITSRAAPGLTPPPRSVWDTQDHEFAWYGSVPVSQYLDEASSCGLGQLVPGRGVDIMFSPNGRWLVVPCPFSWGSRGTVLVQDVFRLRQDRMGTGTGAGAGMQALGMEGANTGANSIRKFGETIAVSDDFIALSSNANAEAPELSADLGRGIPVIVVYARAAHASLWQRIQIVAPPPRQHPLQALLLGGSMVWTPYQQLVTSVTGYMRTRMETVIAPNGSVVPAPVMAGCAPMGMAVVTQERIIIVATTGHDSNPGTEALPLRTIGAAVLLACGLHTRTSECAPIHVRPGQYPIDTDTFRPRPLTVLLSDVTSDNVATLRQVHIRAVPDPPSALSVPLYADPPPSLCSTPSAAAHFCSDNTTLASEVESESSALARSQVVFVSASSISIPMGRVTVEGVTFRAAIDNPTNVRSMLALTGVHGATFRRCVFEGAHTTRGYKGGAFVIRDSQEIVFEYCLFRNNSASFGGALYLQDASAALIGCAFVSNQARDADGGAVAVVNGLLSMVGTVAAANQIHVFDSLPKPSSAVHAAAEHNHWLTRGWVDGVIPSTAGLGAGLSHPTPSTTPPDLDTGSGTGNGTGIGIGTSAAGDSLGGCSALLRLQHDPLAQPPPSDGSTDLTMNGGAGAWMAGFVGNSAAEEGGAVFASLRSTVRVLDQCFVGNQARSGGGVFLSDALGVEVEGAMFWKNEATERGGAAVIMGGNDDTLVYIHGSVWQENVAGSLGGGGMSLRQCPSAIVVGNLWYRNSVMSSGTGGGLEVCGTADLQLLYNSWEGNMAGNSGGDVSLVATNASIHHTNSTAAYAAISGGSIIIDARSTAQLIQSWIHGSVAGVAGGAVIATGGSTLSADRILLSSTLVTRWPTDWWGIMEGGSGFSAPSPPADLYNTLAPRGGGIACVDSTCRLNGSSFSDVCASVGPAVYLGCSRSESAQTCGLHWDTAATTGASPDTMKGTLFQSISTVCLRPPTSEDAARPFGGLEAAEDLLRCAEGVNNQTAWVPHALFYDDPALRVVDESGAVYTDVPPQVCVPAEPSVQVYGVARAVACMEWYLTPTPPETTYCDRPDRPRALFASNMAFSLRPADSPSPIFGESWAVISGTATRVLVAAQRRRLADTQGQGLGQMVYRHQQLVGGRGRGEAAMNTSLEGDAVMNGVIGHWEDGVYSYLPSLTTEVTEISLAFLNATLESGPLTAATGHNLNLQALGFRSADVYSDLRLFDEARQVRMTATGHTDRNSVFKILSPTTSTGTSTGSSTGNVTGTASRATVDTPLVSYADEVQLLGCQPGAAPASVLVVGDGASAATALTFQRCQACTIGLVAPEGKECRPCPQGYEPQGLIQCRKCPEGSASPTGRRCVECESGHYAIPGSAVCRPCPMFVSVANTEVFGTCDAGVLRVSSTGYWFEQPGQSVLDRDEATRFHACTPSSACLTSFNASALTMRCEAGRKGPMCVQCQHGHALLGSSCRRCLSPAVSVLMMIGLLAIMISIILALLLRRVRRTAGKSVRTGVFRITLSYFQISLILVSDYVAHGPSTFATLIGLSSGTGGGLSLSSYPMQCAHGFFFSEQTVAIVLLPPALGLGLAGIVFLLDKRKQRRQQKSASEHERVDGSDTPSPDTPGPSTTQNQPTRRPTKHEIQVLTIEHNVHSSTVNPLLMAQHKPEMVASERPTDNRNSGPSNRRPTVQQIQVIHGVQTGHSDTINPLLAAQHPGTGSSNGKTLPHRGGDSPSTTKSNTSSTGNTTSFSPPSVGALIQRAMIITMFLLYNQIAAQLLRVFDLYAYPLYGERVLRLDTSITTSSPTYASLVFVAAAGIFVYVIAFPIGAALYLRKHHAKLSSLEFRGRWGFMYDGYELNRWYWWESLQFLKKSTCVTVAALIDDPFQQSFIGSMMLAGFLLIHLSARPYLDPLLNFVEGVVWLVLLLTSLISMLHYQVGLPDIGTTIVLMTMHVALIGWLVYLMVLFSMRKHRRMMADAKHARTTPPSPSPRLTPRPSPTLGGTRPLAGLAPSDQSCALSIRNAMHADPSVCPTPSAVRVTLPGGISSTRPHDLLAVDGRRGMHGRRRGGDGGSGMYAGLMRRLRIPHGIGDVSEAKQHQAAPLHPMARLGGGRESGMVTGMES